MKKIISICTLLLILCFALIACEDEHSCSFGAWSYDTSNHWRVCTGEGCGKTSESAPHELVADFDANGSSISRCSVCGYTEPRINTQVASCEEWDSIFNTFKPTNYTVKAFVKRLDYSTGEILNLEQISIVTENARYFCTIGGENQAYITRDASEEYTLYLYGEELPEECSEDKFYRIGDEGIPKRYFEMAAAQMSMIISFKGSFDSFTYDSAKNVYACASKIEAKAYQGQREVTLFCSNIEVSIVNGAIASINCNYNFSLEDDEYYAVSIYDIGASKVEVPQEILSAPVVYLD